MNNLFEENKENEFKSHKKFNNNFENFDIEEKQEVTNSNRIGDFWDEENEEEKDREILSLIKNQIKSSKYTKNNSIEEERFFLK